MHLASENNLVEWIKQPETSKQHLIKHRGMKAHWSAVRPFPISGRVAFCKKA
jgi:hypothetical protein